MPSADRRVSYPLDGQARGHVSSIPKRKTRVSDILARLSSSTAASRAKSGNAGAHGEPSRLRTVFRHRVSSSTSTSGSANTAITVVGPTSIPVSTNKASRIPALTERAVTEAIKSKNAETPRRTRASLPASFISDGSRPESNASYDPSYRNSTSPIPQRRPSQRTSYLQSPQNQSSFSKNRYSVMTNMSTATTMTTATSVSNTSFDALDLPSVPGLLDDDCSIKSKGVAQVVPVMKLGRAKAESPVRATFRSGSPRVGRVTVSQGSHPINLYARPASRQQRVNVRLPRPNSRMRHNMPRVDELKSKIKELEEVLQSSRQDRLATSNLVEQVRMLEEELESEHEEKEMLLLKIKKLEQQNPSRISTASSELAPNYPQTLPLSPAMSDDMPLATETESKLRSRILKLESTIQNLLLSSKNGDENDDVSDEVFRLETEVNVLLGDNQNLRTENQNLQLRVKMIDEENKVLKEKIATVETDLRKVSNMHEDLQLQTSDITSMRKQWERDYLAKEKLNSNLQSQLEELKDRYSLLDKKYKEEGARFAEERSEFEKGNLIREELQRQVQNILQSKRTLEKTNTVLERDNRRAKRLNAALETSMQDLKISLEEKAMENDELNRSILKVMEQASETIEGAKRHSMLINSPMPSSASPLFDMDRRSSIDKRVSQGERLSFGDRRISYRSRASTVSSQSVA